MTSAAPSDSVRMLTWCSLQLSLYAYLAMIGSEKARNIRSTSVLAADGIFA